MNLTGQKPYQKGARRPSREDDSDDSHYQAWLREQPSAVSKLYPCVSAHYRTAKNSGTATKPPFSAIPLTDKEHKEQHRIGQFNFKPRAWWEATVNMHQQAYMRETGRKIPERFLVL